jgi:hypothetical protein
VLFALLRSGAESSQHQTIHLVTAGGLPRVRDLLTALQTLPRDAELLAFEDGSEDYCEREVDDHLGPSEMAAP